MTKRGYSTDDSLTVTIEEAAQILGISPWLTRRLAEDGTIPSVRLGKLYRISRARLMELVNGEKPSS
jgi:excisionase family DNA binding protein